MMVLTSGCGSLHGLPLNPLSPWDPRQGISSTMRHLWESWPEAVKGACLAQTSASARMPPESELDVSSNFSYTNSARSVSERLKTSVSQDPAQTRDAMGHWCGRLYEEKAAALILYGRALGLSHGEAEDVLQEVFVQLLKRSNPPEAPAFFCLRAFRNRALNHRRSFWRRWTRELESTRWFETNPDTTEWETLAMRALAALPAPQRETIVLKIWHGHTFEEIGELLELSPHTVAGRYRYGLQKLRLAIHEYARTEPGLSGTNAPFLAAETAIQTP